MPLKKVGEHAEEDMGADAVVFGGNPDAVPAGQGGWGAKGKLDLTLIQSLGKRG